MSLPAIRRVILDDLATVIEMLHAYMIEVFAKPWSGTRIQLIADLTAQRLQLAIAEREGVPIGFIAWTTAYDLHHCVHGGELNDLYVVPTARGRGVAPALIAFACQALASEGGVFIKGTAVPTAVKTYARVAWGWDCHELILGGRAFRTIAQLAGAAPRDIVRGLPDPAWNHEP